MKTDVRVRTWVRGTDDEVRTGLLGYLSVLYHDLVLDGLTLRQTADRRFVLSFPAKTDRGGRKHPYFRPIDDTARIAIEREILAQLGQRPDAAVVAEEGR